MMNENVDNGEKKMRDKRDRKTLANGENAFIYFPTREWALQMIVSFGDIYIFHIHKI